MPTSCGSFDDESTTHAMAAFPCALPSVPALQTPFKGESTLNTMGTSEQSSGMPPWSRGQLSLAPQQTRHCSAWSPFNFQPGAHTASLRHLLSLSSLCGYACQSLISSDTSSDVASLSHKYGSCSILSFSSQAFFQVTLMSFSCRP